MYFGVLFRIFVLILFESPWGNRSLVPPWGHYETYADMKHLAITYLFRFNIQIHVYMYYDVLFENKKTIIQIRIYLKV